MAVSLRAPHWRNEQRKKMFGKYKSCWDITERIERHQCHRRMNFNFIADFRHAMTHQTHHFRYWFCRRWGNLTELDNFGFVINHKRKRTFFHRLTPNCLPKNHNRIRSPMASGWRMKLLLALNMTICTWNDLIVDANSLYDAVFVVWTK